MSSKYLLHFAHEHVSFRWPELLALTSRYNCSFELISARDHLSSRPYIIIELNDETKQENLVQVARESFLLKDLYELWACSKESVEDLANQILLSPYFKGQRYSSQTDQPFRIECQSFASKLTQEVKINYMKKLKFLETFKSKIDLKNPKQIYTLFEFNDVDAKSSNILSKEYYFARHLARSSRALVEKFSLKKRHFIANTSMDPLLSFIATNVANVRRNDLVYDPFVGSGSLLVPAAYRGAYVMGADIDWKLIHGKSKPSRKGVKERQESECVRANLKQYGLESRYIDMLVSDITKRPFCERFTLDSIITDPPYGIREASEKIGGENKRKAISNGADGGGRRFPSKTNYGMVELLVDLLILSAKHLRIGGRLVYYLPVARTDEQFDEFIPTHPCLKLMSFCDQALTSKNYRLMVVMKKMKEPSCNDVVTVPQLISDKNFRAIYFGGKC